MLLRNRSFPENLRLFTEYSALICMTFLWNWYFELGSSVSSLEFEAVGPGFSNACSLFSIRLDFLGDMIRSTCFSAIIRYFVRYETCIRVPIEYVRQYQDFIKDTKCCFYFRKYLQNSGQIHLERMLVKSLIESPGGLEAGGSYKILEVPAELEESFSAYKRTRSFATLRAELKIASEIEALGLKKYS
jgi:hypothetical protein